MPHGTLSRKSRNPYPTAFDFMADIEPDQKRSEALNDIGVNPIKTPLCVLGGQGRFLALLIARYQMHRVRP